MSVAGAESGTHFERALSSSYLPDEAMSTSLSDLLDAKTTSAAGRASSGLSAGIRAEGDARSLRKVVERNDVQHHTQGIEEKEA